MITSYASLANDLRLDFKTSVVDVLGLSTQYENAPFEPPQNTPWLSYSVLFGSEEQVEMGGDQGTFRFVGLLYARIFVPAESGTGNALEIADAIADHYRIAGVAGVVFRAPDIAVQRRDDEWWVTTVICPFYADRFA